MSEGKVKVDIIKLALVIYLLVFGVITLEKLGIIIPIVKEIIVSSYLLLIPGLLVIKTLRLNASLEELILLSIGASISTITLLSLLANVAFSQFYERPISEVPLTLIISGFTLLALALCYRKGDRQLIITCNYRETRFVLLSSLPPTLMLMSKMSGINALSFFLLVMISITPLIALLGKASERAYPLLVLSTSLSLMVLFLFEVGPIAWTPWKTGEAVKIAGFWDPLFRSQHNSMLVPYLFHPTFSVLSGMDLEMGSKVLDSMIFSLIPMALYLIYRRFLDPSTSFLAACLYTFYPFYDQLLVMNRTGFAFFFTSLILLLIVSEGVSLKSGRLLLMIFAFSLITSHYGTAYLFMILLMVVLLLRFYKKNATREIKQEIIPPTFIILFVIMAFSWYMYTSGAQNFEWGVDFGRHVVANLKDFFNPEKSAAMRAFTTRSVTPSFSLEATKWLLFITLIFIVIGAAKLLYLYLRGRVDTRYAILTLAFCSVLIGMTQMGMPRIFGFSLLLAAPLAVQGLSEILRLVKVREEKRLLVFSIFLFMLFAFNYGIVANTINTVMGEAVDMSLHGTFREKILEGNNLDFKRLVYYVWQPDSTFESAKWLFSYCNPAERTYIDSIIADTHLLELQLPKEYGGKVLHNLTQPALASIKDVLAGKAKEGYVFLASHNIRDDFICVVDPTRSEKYYRLSDYHHIFDGISKVYDSGGGEILILKEESKQGELS